MLIDIATASPPFKITQQRAADELKKRMKESVTAGRLIDAIALHSGIKQRQVVIPDAEDSSEEKFYSAGLIELIPDTKTRMVEYEKWAKRLGKEAVTNLFANNKISQDSISRIITISCTGFFAPGLDYYLIEEFELSRDIKRTNIGFMGCAASVIGFDSAFESFKSSSDEQNILLVSVEICSLHVQFAPTKDNILANMLFADGCAAALFSASFSTLKPKLALFNTASFLFDNSDKYMDWKIGNVGFEMILSHELPKIILEEAVPRLNKILSDFGFKKQDITHWALHPGGRAILDSLQKGLNLTDEQMNPSRTVLENFGNMSSASILFVIKEILNSAELKRDELLCATAFGPGLTMEVALFKVA
jgi:predicted naringenin-chalcone synthase